MRRPKLDPSWLPPGSEVGPWKVRAFHGGGSFGAVFRAVRTRRVRGGEVALKVASMPGDLRFQREVELLTRVRHPSVPQLLWSGEWQRPGGAAYPVLAMEWVEGLSLYAWAERCNPSSREVSGVLAQVARALEATHAAGGVHRDVKGENVLVVVEDERAYLTDFGAGHYAGAARLTREGLPPGTDAYRSPEAWEFELHRGRNSMEVYAAQPADDVFALGVSAYRLVTGEYPPEVEVREEERGPGRLEWRAPRPARELNPRVEEGLSELLGRVLTARPEERPSARELAEALEQAVLVPAPGAERPLREAKPVHEERVHVRAARASWVGYAACALLGAVLATAVLVWGGKTPGSGARFSGREEHGSARPVGLGEPDSASSITWRDEPFQWRFVSLPMPKQPFDGQRRAPLCRPPVEVAINGGCWIDVPTVKPPCGELTYEWQGSCYVPHIPAQRKPTSEP